MSIDVTVRDETTSGELLQELALQLTREQITVSELIRSRVEAEVRIYNARSSEKPFRGLVQPEAHEQQLNPARTAKRIDSEQQVEVALAAFARGRILLLVDDRQVTELADEVLLHPGSAVTVLKLTPLVGG
jgi:hypothetical protein